ncbi:glycerate kinase family protein [Clostridium argentinense CDC 2741]|uniref:Glycerate kinase family protein n=1 Tax=Clostridium argentinense CDC 2741 TaxID=1418104 RepID=A0A0C1UAW0_9CLOT|nr:glycerate kinase [Clostridium argentinense]ARC84025.1 glycerate kinase [Clostridium argentinense]KIE44720.1 glycerate kinase family protein [Clostridium argentinense CDC 2741]NFF39369.1 glycerate kinase [Clostridium argentinense]NFP50426.1 glycerate kinase [Clostridium argentinense]NFP73350.1 glycerate kinase [Clostridium argentinense]
MTLKFVLAPDSFKESMSSKEACDAMERGIKKVIDDAECIKIPMADGGEGTLEALVEATNGRIYDVEVMSPLMEKITAYFGILGNSNTAVIEMASASGIMLVSKEKRNPLITTTYGTGQLIKAALDKGINHLIIGIGGSATNDGGAGMIMALGAKLLDDNGIELDVGGGELYKLHKIDISNLDSRIKDLTVEVACDVKNPLIGPEGASQVFGPQKGATGEMVEILDKSLEHYAKKIKEQLGIDISTTPGAGAAGGLGGGLLAFLNGELRSGVDLVIHHTGLEEKIKNSNYVITGEGSVDGQTIFGKTPVGVSKIAKKYNVPVIVVAGKIGNDIEPIYDEGVVSIFSILQEVTDLEKALEDGKENLEKTLENIARLLVLDKAGC